MHHVWHPGGKSLFSKFIRIYIKTVREIYSLDLNDQPALFRLDVILEDFLDLVELIVANGFTFDQF
jgi:hypothetical protein